MTGGLQICLTHSFEADKQGGEGQKRICPNICDFAAMGARQVKRDAEGGTWRYCSGLLLLTGSLQ